MDLILRRIPAKDNFDFYEYTIHCGKQKQKLNFKFI
jgi:hypothetical protein